MLSEDFNTTVNSQKSETSTDELVLNYRLLVKCSVDIQSDHISLNESNATLMNLASSEIAIDSLSYSTCKALQPEVQLKRNLSKKSLQNLLYLKHLSSTQIHLNCT